MVTDENVTSAAVVVRRANINDLPTLLDFEQGIVAAERPLDETLRDGTIHYYDLPALLAADDAHVVVATRHDTIVASGWARLRDSVPYVQHDRHVFLGFMYVVPAMRGQGINTLILTALTAWAREQGISEAVLEVYVDNASALRAYRKAGFLPRLLEMRRSI